MVDSKLPISSDSTIFTIGSCFARNIEQQLKKLGYKVPLLGFSVPKEEWVYETNSILNNYTPTSIYQEIKWLADIYDKGGVVSGEDVRALGYETKSGFIDLQLRGQIPVSIERLVERRQQIYDISKCVFSAELVVITLGLIEVWQDVETGTYLQESPTSRAMLQDKKRFKFRVLRHDECMKNIEDAISLIKERNPGAHILMTTSPVPLARTFTDDDVITANMHSKSKLRSVCGELAESGLVTYFPSYESVILTKSWDIWQDDLIHVKPWFIGKIINKLTSSCFDIPQDLLLYQRTFSGGTSSENIEVIRQALSIQEKPEYLHRLGELLEANNQPAKAKAEFEKALNLDPANGHSHFRLACCEFKLGNLDKAFAVAAQAIELLPSGDAGVYRLLHQMHLQKGETALAHEALRKVYSLSPNLVHFDIEKIRELKAAGDLTAALDAANKLLDLNDDHPALHIELGVIYRRLNDFPKAIDALEKAIALDPERPEPYAQLSQINFASGDLDLAIENARKAVAANGASKAYHQHLANLLRAAGNGDAALSRDKEM